MKQSLVRLILWSFCSRLTLQPCHSLVSDYWIEHVKSCEEVLDVLAFRAMGPEADAAQFKAQLRERMPQSIQRFQAAGKGGKIVQFAAKCQSFVGKNALVVGAVDAKYQPPSRVRSSDADVRLPSRMHIKNLKVDPSFQRNGIGTVLLSAVENYSSAEYPETEALTLIVDRHLNGNAVRLYEREGFAFWEEAGGGFMMKKL